MPVNIEDDEDKKQRIRNPAFLAATILISIKEISHFAYLFSAKILTPKDVEIGRLMHVFNSQNKTTYFQLSREEKEEILEALIKDYGLDSAQRKLLEESAAIRFVSPESPLSKPRQDPEAPRRASSPVAVNKEKKIGKFRYYSYYLSKILRQFSAVRTLKERLLWRDRKCLFSVTNASAPTHSVYAAIKASAGFRPFVSYLAPNSNGTSVSSSIFVKVFIRSINSLKASGVKLLRNSSVINRGIRREIILACSKILSTSFSHDGYLILPREKIYSLLSRMSNKFLLPKSFSGLTNAVDHFLLTHSFIWRTDPRHELANFIQPLFGFFDIFSHSSSPLITKIPSLDKEVKIISHPIRSGHSTALPSQRVCSSPGEAGLLGAHSHQEAVKHLRALLAETSLKLKDYSIHLIVNSADELRIKLSKDGDWFGVADLTFLHQSRSLRVMSFRLKPRYQGMGIATTLVRFAWQEYPWSETLEWNDPRDDGWGFVLRLEQKGLIAHPQWDSWWRRRIVAQIVRDGQARLAQPPSGGSSPAREFTRSKADKFTSSSPVSPSSPSK